MWHFEFLIALCDPLGDFHISEYRQIPLVKLKLPV
jgi:hypothetical protein